MSGDEYAEALRWFRENPRKVDDLDDHGTDRLTQEHAATIVRAALAAGPADPDTWSEVDDARKSREDVINERDAMRRAWKHEQERRKALARELVAADSVGTWASTADTARPAAHVGPRDGGAAGDDTVLRFSRDEIGASEGVEDVDRASGDDTAPELWFVPDLGVVEPDGMGEWRMAETGGYVGALPARAVRLRAAAAPRAGADTGHAALAEPELAPQMVVGSAGVPIDAYDAIEILSRRDDHPSRLLAETARKVADWWNDPPSGVDCVIRDEILRMTPEFSALLWELLGGGPGDVSDARPAGDDPGATGEAP